MKRGRKGKSAKQALDEILAREKAVRERQAQKEEENTSASSPETSPSPSKPAKEQQVGKVALTMVQNASGQRHATLFAPQEAALRDKPGAVTEEEKEEEKREQEILKVLAPIIEQEKERNKNGEVVAKYKTEGGEELAIKLAARNNFSFALTNFGEQVLWGIAFLVQDLESTDIIPASSEQWPSRVICLNELSKLLFGEDRPSHRGRIFSELMRLHCQFQAWLYDVDNDGQPSRRMRVLPLIRLQGDISIDGEGQDYAHIQMSPVFYYRLENHYIPVARRVFEVWSRKGHQTSLSFRLTGALLAFQHRARYAVKMRLDRYEKEGGDEADLQTDIQELLTYRATPEGIMKIVPTDYSSGPHRLQAFWHDLGVVVEGMKEMGIVTDFRKYGRGKKSVISIVVAK